MQHTRIHDGNEADVGLAGSARGEAISVDFDALISSADELLYQWTRLVESATRVENLASSVERTARALLLAAHTSINNGTLRDVVQTLRAMRLDDPRGYVWTTEHLASCSVVLGARVAVATDAITTAIDDAERIAATTGKLSYVATGSCAESVGSRVRSHAKGVRAYETIERG